MSMSLYLPMYARHIKQEPWMNKDNKGLGIENEDWGVGYYKNTLNKDSFYLYKKLLERRFGPATVEALFGGATGYPDYPIAPMVGLRGKLDLPQNMYLQGDFILNPKKLNHSPYAISIGKRF